MVRPLAVLIATPHFDPTSPLPLSPFGLPPCTDGSEFGDAPGFSGCAPQCYVAHTEIGQLETLGGTCAAGITPRLTPSQELQPESTPVVASGNGVNGSPGGTSEPSGERPVPPGEREGSGGDPGEHAASNAELTAAVTRAYARRCAGMHTAAGRRACTQALARIAGGELTSVGGACRRASERRTGRAHSEFHRCAVAARRFRRSLPTASG